MKVQKGKVLSAVEQDDSAQTPADKKEGQSMSSLWSPRAWSLQCSVTVASRYVVSEEILPRLGRFPDQITQI